MAEITEMIKELFHKFDTSQEDINNLKKGGRKQKKSKCSHRSCLGLGLDLGVDLGPPRGTYPDHKGGNLRKNCLQKEEAPHHILGE